MHCCHRQTAVNFDSFSGSSFQATRDLGAVALPRVWAGKCATRMSSLIERPRKLQDDMGKKRLKPGKAFPQAFVPTYFVPLGKSSLASACQREKTHWGSGFAPGGPLWLRQGQGRPIEGEVHLRRRSLPNRLDLWDLIDTFKVARSCSDARRNSHKRM